MPTRKERRERRERGGRRERGERGAVLVEAAIMVPLIVLLTFGAIEYGFAFNEQGTVRAATRSAARSAAALPKADAADLEAAVVNALGTAVRNLANGTPVEAWIFDATAGSRPATCATDCRAYDWDAGAGFFESPAGASGDPWTAAERNACAGSSDKIGVYLKVRHDLLTGLPLTASGDRFFDLESTTIMALEPVQASGCAATA